MQEYWVNVYEYETVKNTQFYSHCVDSRELALHYAITREKFRFDAKCIYRIHVKMKPVSPPVFGPNFIKLMGKMLD